MPVVWQFGRAGKHPSLFLKKRISRNALIGSGAGCRSGEWAAIWRRGVSDKFVMTKTRDLSCNSIIKFNRIEFRTMLAVFI